MALSGAHEVFETGSAERGLELARDRKPDVIVLDAEIEAIASSALSADFREQSLEGAAHLVLLGSARGVRECFPRGDFVRKPYHYGTLVRKIESLLSRDPATTPV